MLNEYEVGDKFEFTQCCVVLKYVLFCLLNLISSLF